MSRVYTDLGVFDVGRDGARFVEAIEGLGIDDLRTLADVPLSA